MQKATHDFVLAQKATHSLPRLIGDFVLAQKRIDVFYKLNSIIQEAYVYCAHRPFKELVA